MIFESDGIGERETLLIYGETVIADHCNTADGPSPQSYALRRPRASHTVRPPFGHEIHDNSILDSSDRLETKDSDLVHGTRIDHLYGSLRLVTAKQTLLTRSAVRHLIKSLKPKINYEATFTPAA